MKLLRYLIFAFGLLLGERVYGAAMATLTNFNAVDFVVNASPTATPTNVIKINHDTFTATNIYVTNLFVTYEVVSNVISGNIQGTPPHLAMFWPDNFSVTDSIVTQDADTNGITVNGVGDGSITLGATPPITIQKSVDDIYITNGGPFFNLLSGGTLVVGTNTLSYAGPARVLRSGAVATIDGLVSQNFVLENISDPTYAYDAALRGDANLGGSTNTPTAAFSTSVSDISGYSHVWNLSSGFDQSSSTLEFVEYDSLLNPTVYCQLRPEQFDLIPYLFDTLFPVPAANLFEVRNNKTNLFGLTYDGKIQVGGSLTNLVYRNISDLVYSNGTNDPKIAVVNGSGENAKFGLTPGGLAQVLADTGKSVAFNVNGVSGGVIFDGTELAPNASGKDLGGSGSNDSWRDFWLNRYANISGFNDGAGNYSRLRVNHTGTNGAIVFDSQSAGTAGSPKPTWFDFGGTNYFQFNYETAGHSLQPEFAVQGDPANFIKLQMLGGTVPHINASGENVYLDNGLASKNLLPYNDNLYDIGTAASNGAWKDIYQKGHHYLEGANDGTGNFIWLDSFISNNVVILNFKNGGTGPTPTSFSFRINGAEQSHIP